MYYNEYLLCDNAKALVAPEKAANMAAGDASPFLPPAPPLRRINPLFQADDRLGRRRRTPNVCRAVDGVKLIAAFLLGELIECGWTPVVFTQPAKKPTEASRHRTRIACIVDLNPAKCGRFLPGTGHPTVGYADLPRRGVSSAILMNPNYHKETVTLLARAGVPVKLVALAACDKEEGTPECP